MTKAETVYLGLGGNLGRPADAMARALQAIDRDDANSVMAVSPLYRTPPWGKRDQPDFVNAAARISTRMAPRELLSFCLALERENRRERLERWGPRTLDIDLLIFGDRTVDEPGLTLPHPQMTERGFVMVPLSDIAPDLLVDGRPVRDWAERLADGAIDRIGEGTDWWLGMPSSEGRR